MSIDKVDIPEIPDEVRAAVIAVFPEAKMFYVDDNPDHIRVLFLFSGVRFVLDLVWGCEDVNGEVEQQAAQYLLHSLTTEESENIFEHELKDFLLWGKGLGRLRWLENQLATMLKVLPPSYDPTEGDVVVANDGIAPLETEPVPAALQHVAIPVSEPEFTPPVVTARTLFAVILTGSLSALGVSVFVKRRLPTPVVIVPLPQVPIRRSLPTPIDRPPHIVPIPACPSFTVTAGTTERGLRPILRRLEIEQQPVFTTYHLSADRLLLSSIRPRHRAEAEARNPNDPRNGLGVAARYRFGRVLVGDQITLEACPPQQPVFTHTRSGVTLYRFTLR